MESPSGSRSSRPCQHPDLILPVSRVLRLNIHCFHHPSVGSVMAAPTDHRPGPDPSPLPTLGSSCTPLPEAFRQRARGSSGILGLIQARLGHPTRAPPPCSPMPLLPWAPSGPVLPTRSWAQDVGVKGQWGRRRLPLRPSRPTEEEVAPTRMLTGLQTPPEVESSALGTSGQPGPEVTVWSKGGGLPRAPTLHLGPVPTRQSRGPGGTGSRQRLPRQSSPFLVAAASVPSERC